MKDPTHPGAVVGRQEAADIIGISRQRLGVLTDGAPASGDRKPVEPDPNFPAPFCAIDEGARPLWWRRAIEDYAATRTRRKASPASDAVPAGA